MPLLQVWDLFYDADSVRSMLTRKIQEESLRTYLFTYSNVYDSISIVSIRQTQCRSSTYMFEFYRVWVKCAYCVVLNLANMANGLWVAWSWSQLTMLQQVSMCNQLLVQGRQKIGFAVVDLAETYLTPLAMNGHRLFPNRAYSMIASRHTLATTL